MFAYIKYMYVYMYTENYEYYLSDVSLSLSFHIPYEGWLWLFHISLFALTLSSKNILIKTVLQTTGFTNVWTK